MADILEKLADICPKVADFINAVPQTQGKEVISLNQIIDFIAIKQQKQDEKLDRMFRKANSLQDVQEIDKLVEEKALAVQDHKLFLAFLKYLEVKELEPQAVFKEVLLLPKFQFEERYQMNWHSVVQLCFTFLAILKKNDPQQYLEFIVTN
ncbi:hypothetical protein [Ureibacillus chungkukjangi]|uniref:Uncharacterized protein n=1 Tax=Ureibacillus chungkukjangi TaxID=1202712 RepID=A0A318TMV9_9BACL|nr:hypothetical protein [Ureibacillus chungkukjangi]PYF06086.1 hypothetical protein BJ095_11247 [Ureibacillus chungkukjangi]